MMNKEQIEEMAERIINKAEQVKEIAKESIAIINKEKVE